MEKFFFGAYEDIYHVIAFLVSVGFIKYKSQRNSILKVTEKSYYVTNLADEKISLILNTASHLKWYMERCLLIKKYFGEYSGTQLKTLNTKLISIVLGMNQSVSVVKDGQNPFKHVYYLRMEYVLDCLREAGVYFIKELCYLFEVDKCIVGRENGI